MENCTLWKIVVLRAYNLNALQSVFPKSRRNSGTFASIGYIFLSIKQTEIIYICMKSTLQEALNGVFGSFLQPIFWNFRETNFIYFDTPEGGPAGTVLQSHFKK